MTSFLYKFRSLDGASLARTRSIIANQKLYFASPDTLNDPFDCAPILSTQATDEELFAWLRPITIQRNPLLLPDEIDAETRLRVAGSISLSSQEAKDMYEKVFQRAKSDLGVLCFSEVPDDYTMWSYYADSHRGVCLQFARTPGSYFADAKPVTYSEVRPTLNIFTQPMDEQVDAALMHKASRWANEREWRVFRSRRSGGPGEYGFPPGSLRAIILGAKVTPQMEAEVRSWVGPLPVLRAAIDPSAYRIQIAGLQT